MVRSVAWSLARKCRGQDDPETQGQERVLSDQIAALEAGDLLLRSSEVGRNLAAQQLQGKGVDRANSRLVGLGGPRIRHGTCAGS